MGSYDIPNLIAEQTVFGLALKHRMGWIKAATTLFHLMKQTLRPEHVAEDQRRRLALEEFLVLCGGKLVNGKESASLLRRGENYQNDGHNEQYGRDR
jgi:hypothetical protein